MKDSARAFSKAVNEGHWPSRAHLMQRLHAADAPDSSTEGAIQVRITSSFKALSQRAACQESEALDVRAGMVDGSRLCLPTTNYSPTSRSAESKVKISRSLLERSSFGGVMHRRPSFGACKERS